MDCLGPSDDDNGSSPDGRRVRIDRWSRQCLLKAPARHGVAAKYVDARPGQAGRLLPNGKGWLAWANTARQLESVHGGTTRGPGSPERRQPAIMPIPERRKAEDGEGLLDHGI